MQVLLYNCFEKMGDDIGFLFESRKTSVYLAVSREDILRLLQGTGIEVAVLATERLDDDFLRVMHVYPHTRFLLLGEQPANVAFPANASFIPAAVLHETLSLIINEGA